MDAVPLTGRRPARTSSAVADCSGWPGRRTGGNRQRLLQALWDHPTPPSTPSPAAPASPAPSASRPATRASGAAAPTAAPALTRVEMLCRDGVARPTRPGWRQAQPPMTNMTIHHTAVVLGDNSNAPARLRQHQHYHQDTHGWIDIAYHVSVDRKATSSSCDARARGQHRDELRPHRPFPRRLRGKLRRRGGDGRTAQRGRPRIRLGGTAIRHPDRDARGPP